MKKAVFELWMLAAVVLLGLASCTDNDDNVVVNVTAGHMVLKNDLPDGMSISNVEVYNADDNTKVSEFENTIPNGSEQKLGTFNTNLKFTVIFKARKSGADMPRIYKYTTNPSIKLNHKAKTTLYANGDFAVQ